MALERTHYILTVVFLVMKCLSLSETKLLLRAQSFPVNEWDVLYTGAVEDSIAFSAVTCMTGCISNDKCLSFFYNTNTLQCIMHPMYHKFIKSSSMETGWRYHITKDVSGRCSTDHLLYRNLDFCYDIFWIDATSFPAIKTACATRGGKLAAITSQEVHEYFKIILADRFVPRVCIDGTEQLDGTWKLDDGTNLTYFDWYPGQPNNLQENCLVIREDDQFKDCPCTELTKSCQYVCEF